NRRSSAISQTPGHEPTWMRPARFDDCDDLSARTSGSDARLRRARRFAVEMPGNFGRSRRAGMPRDAASGVRRVFGPSADRWLTGHATRARKKIETEAEVTVSIAGFWPFVPWC